MALTIVADNASGPNYDFNARSADKCQLVVGSWSFPSTYVTGGVTVNLASLGLNNVHFCILEANDAARQYHYDVTTSMALAYYLAPTTTASGSVLFVQLPTNTDVTGDGGYFMAFGT